MNVTTIGLLVLLGVLIVLYVGRRRSRLSKEDRD
jgi:hypothetical protein